MGGSTKLKQEFIASAEFDFQQRFATRTKEVKAKLATPLPDVSEDFKEFEGFLLKVRTRFL